MLHDEDYYEAYYTDKLWNLLPAIYRSEDSDRYEQPGPLRELVGRIGVQAAVLRRSLDRLWEDQSIESCDDWVIPYIADLLATNLTASLDARGQRLDVANTIYYRRRKGTLAILEEIAADISGWEVRVVEFFRRLGRGRHNLDPTLEATAQISLQSNHQYITGDGKTTTFSLTLTPTPLQPGSIQVFVNGSPVAADNRGGVVTGAGVSGTVVYANGQLSLSITPAPDTGALVAVYYEYAILDNRGLLIAEGLLGAKTNAYAGGWADLRNQKGATEADQTLSNLVRLAGNPAAAFDEFSHTADFRRGKGQLGWYNIPNLGVFLWRLQSFAVGKTTPVKYSACPAPGQQYSFDPTGREIPLFAQSVNARQYGDQWQSPADWQLPTPITSAMLALALGSNPAYPLYASYDPLLGKVYANALGVYKDISDNAIPLPPDHLTALAATPTSADYYIDAVRGRLVTRNPTLKDPLWVSYCYGFSSTLGAGPYDRRVLAYMPASSAKPAKGGGDVFATLLGTLDVTQKNLATIGDSLTYTKVIDLGSGTKTISNLTLAAENKTRPLIRLPASTAAAPSRWLFTGGATAQQAGVLLLDGLFVCGGDIALQGFFDTVTLICCTLDPGNTGAKAVDGRDLLPSRLSIEGTVKNLVVQSSVLGNIVVGVQGSLENLSVSDSIIQATTADPALSMNAGIANIVRCTVLGKVNAHQLYASESIFDDSVTVINTQQGCLRFCAYAGNSVVPKQFHSVQIQALAPLFTSREFGQPAYGQLMANADSAILQPAAGDTILRGAENGAEMGAFSRDKNSIKEDSILIKYQEYMPLGLMPVLIYAT